jgi:hypothetical protein
MSFFSGLEPPETEEPLEVKNPESDDILPPARPFDDVSQSAEDLRKSAAVSQIVHTVNEAFIQARDARRPQEDIWLTSYYAWRGEYTPEEKAKIARAKERNNNASEIFIKITKTKATAALGQIQEILFNQDKFPIGIEPQKIPQGIAKDAFIVPEAAPIPQDIYGFAGDGKEIKPGDTGKSLLAGLMERYKTITQGKRVVEGPSPDSKQFPQISPADEAASNMEKTILDQFEQGDIRREIRYLAWETVVLGSGCLKGPFTYSNTTHSWEKDEEGKIVYKPIVEDIPKANYVSIWNLYPDPNCSKIENASYVVEKHLMNRQQVAELKRYSDFDEDAVERVLRLNPIRDHEAWEDAIKDTNRATVDDRYEVLEYWGYLKKEHIEQFNPALRNKLAALVDQAQVNVWMCQNEVLRLVLNPFVPTRLPYYIVPFEEHEYQVWGIGLPENMRDPQALMNGHMRMMIDNLRLAGNVILEVNEAALVPGQGNELYPGRIFRKQTGAGQSAINAVNIPNVAPSHVQAFDKARQLADEATGQPSYSYGQSGVSSTTRTAAGMSMLMGAAAGNTKQVIKNFDEYLLRPLGEAYFAWNMQFNSKADIRGDLKIVAKGTSALMQKEVQSQRLLQFLQIVSGNQLLTPFANMDYILREIAKALDLDPDKTVNDPAMAKLIADIIGSMNNNGQQNNTPSGVAPPAPSGNMDVADTSGGGGSNIGVGTAPQAGEQGFSG